MAKLHWLMALMASAGLGLGGGMASGSAWAADSGSALTSLDAQFLWTCGFNPYNSSSNFLAVGPIYETLAFVNTLHNGNITTWLATDYASSEGDKVLTFTIRKGAKWTDGKPLTPG